VHTLRLGEAKRAAYELLDAGLQMNVFTLNFLRVLLARLMLLGIEMPLVRHLRLKNSRLWRNAFVMTYHF
jgi:hypothetical protein